MGAAVQVLGRTEELDVVSEPGEAPYRPNTITLVDTGTLAEQLTWGKISAEGGTAAFKCVQQALSFALNGSAAAMATAPINKQSLHLAGVPYIDHTTMLKELTGARDAMTMFATGKLKIFFLTRHLALRDVPSALTIDLVIEGITASVGHLNAIGYRRPRLAVAALNPHGGEHGLFGTEEEEVIGPAITQAREKVAAEVVGAVPADVVFLQGAEGRYDAVLSLYHDQGHIAAKTLDFHGTVSFTLGLPFLRTSVDHGTAFDIAGRGQANAHGMKAAIRAASELALPYRTSQKKRQS